MSDFNIDKLIIEVEAKTNEAESGLTSIEEKLASIKEHASSIKTLKNIIPKSTITSITSATEAFGELSKAFANPIKMSIDTDSAKQDVDEVAHYIENAIQDVPNFKIGVDTSGAIKQAGEAAKQISETVQQSLFPQHASSANKNSITTTSKQTGWRFSGADASTVSKSTGWAKDAKVSDDTTSSWKKLNGEAKVALDCFSGVNREAKNFSHEFTKGIPAKNIFERISSSAKKTTAMITKLVKALGKIALAGGKNVGKLFLRFSTLGGAITGTTGRLGKFINSLKRIALYRTVRFVFSEITSIVKTGMENLYFYSKGINGTFAHTMDGLATSFLYLKNSIGAAVSPLLNALAPAIEVVIDKIIAMVNLFNQFFAKLTGKTTWTKAVRTPVSAFEDASNAADNAKDAADKFKESLMGFDEINKLSMDTATGGSGSGSGGGGGADYSSMFTEAPIDDAISDFVEEMRKKIEEQDWDGLGALFADKINSVFLAIDEKVKWDNVGDKIAGKIDAITGTFNGLIHNIDWEMIGGTIGDAITTFAHTLDLLQEKTDFAGLGHGLADMFNGLLTNVDWELVGKVIVTNITSLMTVVDNFIKNVDTEKLGKSIADLVAGFAKASPITNTLQLIVDGINGFIKTIGSFNKWMSEPDENGKTKWDYIKEDIVNGIMSITNIDFKSAGLNISGLATSLFNTLSGALNEIDWNALGGKIAEFIGGIDWTNVVGSALKLIGNGFYAMFELAIGFISNVDWLDLAGQVMKGIGEALKDPKAAMGLTIAITTLTIGKIGMVAFSEAAKEIIANMFSDWNIGGGSGGTGGTGGMSGGCRCECVCQCNCGGSFQNALQNSTVSVGVKSFLGNNALSALGAGLGLAAIGTSLDRLVGTYTGQTSTDTGSSTVDGVSGAAASFGDLAKAMESLTSFLKQLFPENSGQTSSDPSSTGKWVYDGRGGYYEDVGANPELTAWLSSLFASWGENLKNNLSTIAIGLPAAVSGLLSLFSVTALADEATPAGSWLDNLFNVGEKIKLTVEAEGKKGPGFDTVNNLVTAGDSTVTKTANGSKGTWFDTVLGFLGHPSDTVTKTVNASKGSNPTLFDKVFGFLDKAGGSVTKTVNASRGSNTTLFEKVYNFANKTSGSMTKTVNAAKGSNWASIVDKTKAATAKKTVQVGMSGVAGKLLSTSGSSGVKSSWWGSVSATVRWFAQGGIVNKATPAIIGEAGKEAVIPLERNTGWINKLAGQITTRMGGGVNGDVADSVAEGVYRGMLRSADATDGNITIMLDGRVLAQSTVEQLQMMARQGKYPLSSLV